MSQAKLGVCRDWPSFPEIWLSPFEGTEAYVVLESIAEVQFEKLANARNQVLRELPWETGVVFSADHELKWQRRFGKRHAVWTTDIEDFVFPEGFEEVTELKIHALDGEEEFALLWGVSEFYPKEHLIWFDDRIPRQDLSYPLPVAEKGRRVCLQSRTYRVAEEGMEQDSLYHRWSGLEERP